MTDSAKSTKAASPVSQRKAEERAAALLEIARDVTSPLDLATVLERIARRTAAVVPADRVLTYYWDQSSERLKLLSQFGMPEDLVEGARDLELVAGNPPIPQFIKNSPLHIDDANCEPWLSPDVYAQYRMRTLIATPVTVRDRVLGTFLAVRSEMPDDFEAADEAFIENVARHVGLAIETRELYAAQQEEAEVQAALARFSHEIFASLDLSVVGARLCKLTVELLGCDSSHTALLDTTAGMFVPVGAFGYDAETLDWMRLVKAPAATITRFLSDDPASDVRVLRPEDLTQDPLADFARVLGVHAILGIVLRRRGEIIGVHVACYRRPGRSFTMRQQRLARGIAHLAALALENAALVDELTRASRLKTDFLATMSHELRTPLNTIVGYTNLLRDLEFGPIGGEQGEPLARIADAAAQLLGLINATLDVSRMEAGQLPIQWEQVRLADVITTVQTEVAEVPRSDGVRLHWRLADELPELRTDRVKLQIVLKNLVCNALKFTPQGEVIVSLSTMADQFVARIDDTGIGIDPALQQAVFEPFRQGDGSVTRKYGGVGLGLYIVRRLVDMLGGTITLKSEPGNGSTFTVTLPVQGARGGAAIRDVHS